MGAQRLDPRPVDGSAPRLPTPAGQHLGAAPARILGQFLRKTALADARLAGQHEQSSAARAGIIETSDERRQLDLPADKTAGLYLDPRRGRGREVDPWSC
jgi:hypothetical protein